MKLKLEFVQHHHTPFVGLGFLLIIILWTISLLANWVSLHTQALRGQERVAEIELSLKNKQRNAAQSKDEKDSGFEMRIANTKKILASLNYPWNRVLATIEQTEGSGVAILSFDHAQIADQTQLTVEALDLPSLLKFVEKLNVGNDESKWYLSTYQVQAQNNPSTIKGVILIR